MQNWRFQFRLIPTLAMMVGMILFIYLGLWQAGKATSLGGQLAQRQSRSQHGPLVVGPQLVDVAQFQDAPITVTGQYDPRNQIFIDNRQNNGMPGVHVITPLKIDGGESWILVNRGWIGWTSGRSVLPVADVPSGRVQVTGLASVPSAKKFFLMPDRPEAQSRLWSRLDLPRFASLLGQPLQPVVLLQENTNAPDSLVRRWNPPEDRVGMHQSYAVQWFGMAVALAAFYLVASVRKGGQP